MLNLTSLSVLSSSWWGRSSPSTAHHLLKGQGSPALPGVLAEPGAIFTSLLPFPGCPEPRRCPVNICGLTDAMTFKMGICGERGRWGWSLMVGCWDSPAMAGKPSSFGAGPHEGPQGGREEAGDDSTSCPPASPLPAPATQSLHEPHGTQTVLLQKIIFSSLTFHGNSK